MTKKETTKPTRPTKSSKKEKKNGIKSNQHKTISMTIELGFRLKSELMVTETKKKAYTLRSINGILQSLLFFNFIYLLQSNTHGFVLACLLLFGTLNRGVRKMEM